MKVTGQETTVTAALPSPATGTVIVRIPTASVPQVGLVLGARSAARMHATAVATGHASGMEAAFVQMIGQAQAVTAALRRHASLHPVYRTVFITVLSFLLSIILLFTPNQ